MTEQQHEEFDEDYPQAILDYILEGERIERLKIQNSVIDKLIVENEEDFIKKIIGLKVEIRKLLLQAQIDLCYKVIDDRVQKRIQELRTQIYDYDKETGLKRDALHEICQDNLNAIKEYEKRTVPE